MNEVSHLTNNLMSDTLIEKNVFRIPKLWIVGLAFFYLLFPSILFLLEIFRPLYAVPLSIGLVWSVVVCCNRQQKEWGETRKYIICSRRDLFALGCTLVLAVIVVELIGFHGHVKQTNDLIFRNAMYQTLVDQPWPVFSNTGDLFVYYHAYWLPPAFVSKILNGIVSSTTVLWIWYYLAFVTFILLAFCKFRSKILLFFIFLCLLGNIVDILYIPEQLAKQFDNESLNVLPSCLSFLMEGRDTMRFGAFWGNVLFTYNAGTPMVVLLVLLLSGLLPLRYWHLPVSFCISMSPVAAAAIIIYLICIFTVNYKEIKNVLTSVSLYLCCLLVVACCLYFTGLTNTGDATQVCWLWEVQRYDSKFVENSLRFTRYAVISLGVIIPAFLLIRRRLRKNAIFLSMIIAAAVMPSIWIGRSDNIFSFKCGLVIFTFFVWLLVVQWSYYKKWGRIAIVCFVLLSSFHVGGFLVKQKVWRYTWNENQMKKNIADDWGGHMNHQDEYHYKNFFGYPKCPAIQYDKPGESIISL